MLCGRLPITKVGEKVTKRTRADPKKDLLIFSKAKASQNRSKRITTRLQPLENLKQTSPWQFSLSTSSKSKKIGGRRRVARRRSISGTFQNPSAKKLLSWSVEERERWGKTLENS
jgi:hypothetical protein